MSPLVFVLAAVLLHRTEPKMDRVTGLRLAVIILDAYISTADKS